MSEEKEKARRHAEEEESREQAIRPGLPDSLRGPEKWPKATSTVNLMTTHY